MATELDELLGIATPSHPGTLTARDGTIIPIGSTGQLTATEIAAQAGTSLLAPYDGKDPKHFGKTKLTAAYDAVASKAQDGDIGALEVILDRIMGKPVQAVKNLNVTATLKDFLNGISVNDENQSGSGGATDKRVNSNSSTDINPFS